MRYSRNPGQDDRILGQVNALNDLIALAEYPEAAIQAALKFTLSSVDCSSGAILVQPAGEGNPVYIAKEGISEAWEKELYNPGSSLRKISNLVLAGANPHKTQPELQLGAAIPLSTNNMIQGVLLVQAPACENGTLKTLNALAPSIGRTLSFLRSRSMAFEHQRELAALSVMAATLESNQSSGDIQLSIMKNICSILQAEASMLVLVDVDQKDLTIRKMLLAKDDWNNQEGLSIQTGLIQSCIQNGTAILENKVQENPLFNAGYDAPTGMEIQSLLSCPLNVAGETIGAIAVYNKIQGLFTYYEQQLLNAMATALANATHNMRLIQQLKLANADLEASKWELLRSRNTLRALFDNIPSSFYIIDRRYSLIAINMSRADRANSKPPLMVGKKCYQILFGRSEPCPGCRVTETLFGGQSTNRMDRSWVNNDQFMEWDINTYPIYDASNEPVQAILVEQDVTEKRRLEASLAQSEKLAAVGQLAAGVAHEINNPLAAIIANAQILERDLPQDNDLLESVKLIQLAGSRASQVVRNLLGFARKEHYEFSPTDINETIRSSLVLLQHEFVSRPVDLIFDLADDLPPMIASKDHLQGVWINLLLNAFDALEGKPGEVRISTRKLGNEFRITISDTGKGIPPERVSRIFEPFYTTKEAGRGTGLGLSLCHRVVKQHSGFILVESQVGVGTKFIVVLPARPE